MVSMVKVIVPGSKKRSGEVLEGGDQKKQKKMVNVVRTECGKILRTLRTHRFGGVFNEPVDPVQLGIPDYFDVISRPMDFGTISKKLAKDVYSSEEAFAADIRLTFANAMRYNPPSNLVHKMAKQLKDLFERMWNLFEAKLVRLRKIVAEQEKLKKKPLDTTKIANSLPAKTLERNTVKKPAPSLILKFKKAEEDTSTTTACSVNKPLVSREEKINLKRELISAMKGVWTGPLRWFLRKHGLIVSNRELIESTFKSFSDDTLLELSRTLNVSFGTSMETGKEDLGNAQRTNEITERKKLEEKSNIESRIRAARAAKEALLESAKSDLQLRRVKEREKLEKLERTVIIGDNLTFLKELEKLCQYSGIKNPLEKIGLRLKEDYYYGYEDSDDDNGLISDDLEDGEIF